MNERLPTVFTQTPSQHLKCPVCENLYTEPVINIACGHTFCKKCADSLEKCPTDNSECDATKMVVNRLVIGQIEDLEIYCRYCLVLEGEEYKVDPSGCPQRLHIGSRQQHENTCEFALISCSNSGCTAMFRKREMDEHLKVCTHSQCTHHTKGCEFQGRREDIQTHEAVCGYRGLQTTRWSNEAEQRMKLVESENEELKGQVSLLNKRIGQMEDANIKLQGQVTECLGNMKDLQQKFDSLTLTVDQLMTVRNRRSVGSPTHQPESRSRSSSTSSSFRKSGSPPSTGTSFKWAMPFQFKCIGTLRGHKDIVWCMATKNKKLYSSGTDCTVKVWDLENLYRGCIKTLQGHSKAVQCMTIGGNYLYTGGHDNAVYCWNLEDYSLIKCVENAHDNIICGMVVVGSYLFTSSFSLIKVWKTESLEQKQTLTGLHHWVRSLALNPEQDKLYSGSHNTIDIWNVTEPFSLKGKVDHQFGSVYSLAITSKFIIAGTYNRNLHIFSNTSYEHVSALRGHIGVITAVAVSHCEGFCVSSSSDCTVKIWNLENMLPTQTLQRHEGSVNSLVLRGDLLFSGSEDREIKVFMYFQMQMGFALKP